ncbi:transmembrane 220 family protein [Zeaxanthinibacter enoshimensis]|uniref:Transmembrane family 220 protein n=1 Tax=Zeaxanthinibacter enoshimensis TaxID=392009 RepID=A0A4R6TME5_9FLAO|nr:transmembrane 220 family protein [Zeaxanthinibacter enoshimensis]TDQ31018.1 transmembrane family 220 protein [Zeaxanthinibacter enoshimensis]
MKVFFKVFAIVFGILFLWAAFVQYNDPDAFLWYAVYGSAFVISVLFALDRLPWLIPAVLFILFMAGVAYSWPETYQGVTIGEGNIDNIEKAREALGLLIMAILMLIYTLRIRYIRKQP